MRQQQKCLARNASFLNFLADFWLTDVLTIRNCLIGGESAIFEVRVTDYTKMRSFTEKDDPAFRGSLVDTIHYAEKKGLIDSAKVWIENRELRNKIAHEYAAKDLRTIFDQVMEQTPIVLSIKTKLK